jgi:hypothetical protein
MNGARRRLIQKHWDPGTQTSGMHPKTVAAEAKIRDDSAQRGTIYTRG